MQKKYNLKITPSAENDLDDIYNYICNSLLAPISAQSLMDKIENGVKALCDFPYKYELSKDDLLREKGYHKLVINNYIALYLIDEAEKNIIIARVFYGAMDYPKYL